MDQTSLVEALKGLPLSEMRYLLTVGSTNDAAIQWAQDGAKPFCLVVADEQTKGRGRSGRGWLTPPGAAIAMSLLLPTEGISASELARVTGLGALAVCAALQNYQVAARIKWPNDVLLDSKKACGVLAEAHWRGDSLEHIVVGIGINVATPSVPPTKNLNFPATSVESVLGRAVLREELIREVLKALFSWWPRFQSADFITAWESQLAFMGETVEILPAAEQGKAIDGTLTGLNNLGHIRLRLSTGEEKSFEASEIRLRPRVDRPAN